MSLLEVTQVASGYGEVQVLWGAELALEAGKLTALVGSNGAGKTTLLRTVMGQLKLWQGQVSFQGKEISRLPPHAKAELGLALVPEGRQLFTDMTVAENLEMGATPRHAACPTRRTTWSGSTPPSRASRNVPAQKTGTLSGGEQQMVAVARGLMSNPTILFVDEMSLGLAPVLALDLFQALRTLRKEGLTILLVEQNVQMALQVSDYAYVLAEGRTTLHGPAREVAANEQVRRAYLGL